MTENEAIKHLKLCMKTRMFIPNNDVLEMAIQALEEIQQYRAIGTVEDIQLIFSLCKDLQDVIKQYETIGTIEEFKAFRSDDFTEDLLNMGYTKGLKDGYADAIDEFISRLEKHTQENWIDHQEYGITWADIEQIAEQLKGGAE